MTAMPYPGQDLDFPLQTCARFSLFDVKSSGDGEPVRLSR
jgi:hypothetical protein